MIEIIERGWAGHFCASDQCRFRRNTLLVDNEQGVSVIVSTVGAMYMRGELMEIGAYRHYETMTFVATQDGEYIDSDVSLELPYQAGLLMTKENMANVDNLANDMHQRVLAEVCENINNGVISLQIKELREIKEAEDCS
jgi:hypothetical protein